MMHSRLHTFLRLAFAAALQRSLGTRSPGCSTLCDRAAQQIKAFILVGALTQTVHEFLWRRVALKKLLNDVSAGDGSALRRMDGLRTLVISASLPRRVNPIQAPFARRSGLRERRRRPTNAFPA